MKKHVLESADRLVALLPKASRDKWPDLRSLFEDALARGEWPLGVAARVRAALTKKLVHGRAGTLFFGALSVAEGLEADYDVKQAITALDGAARTGVVQLARVPVTADNAKHVRGQVARLVVPQHAAWVESLLDKLTARIEDAKIVASAFEALDAEARRPRVTSIRLTFDSGKKRRKPQEGDRKTVRGVEYVRRAVYDRGARVVSDGRPVFQWVPVAAKQA
jgi:hypothetical protein